MSRHDREAKLEALYGGGPDGMVLVTERGGRKRDARKALQTRMSKMTKMMATTPMPATEVHQPPDAPVMGSYRKGTLGSYDMGSYQKGTLPWTPPSPSQAVKWGEQVVDVPIEELLGLAHKDVSRPGRRSMEKLNRATEYLQSGKGINPAEVSLRGGEAIIDDGFHRLRGAQQLGHKTAPVRVPTSQVSKLRKMLEAGKGAVGGVTALLDPLFGAIQDPSLLEDLDPELRGTLESVLGTFGGGGKGPIG